MTVLGLYIWTCSRSLFFSNVSVKINVRENWRSYQEWRIQRNW